MGRGFAPGEEDDEMELMEVLDDMDLQLDTLKVHQENDVVRGTVIAIDKSGVHFDIGTKIPGFAPKEQVCLDRSQTACESLSSSL